MSKINRSKALVILGKVIAGKEDYVYDDKNRYGTCRYYNEKGAPSCIVGHFFNVAKLPQYILKENNESGFASLTYKAPEVKNFFTADAIQMLQEVQSSQDLGTPWGVAVDKATNAFEDE